MPNQSASQNDVIAERAGIATRFPGKQMLLKILNSNNW